MSMAPLRTITSEPLHLPKAKGWDLPYCIPVMLVIGFLVGGVF